MVNGYLASGETFQTKYDEKGDRKVFQHTRKIFAEFMIPESRQTVRFLKPYDTAAW